MHLQLGSWRDRLGVTPRGAPPLAQTVAACAAGAGLALLTACAPPAGAPPHLTIRWAPSPAVGTESVAEIQLNDAMARPVTGARLRLDAFMTHPGMAPLSAVVEERGSGRYQTRVRFSMAGDWVVRLQGVRSDGRAIDLQQPVRGVRSAE